jgi:hypothetical protein
MAINIFREELQDRFRLCSFPAAEKPQTLSAESPNCQMSDKSSLPNSAKKPNAQAPRRKPGRPSKEDGAAQTAEGAAAEDPAPATGRLTRNGTGSAPPKPNYVEINEADDSEEDEDEVERVRQQKRRRNKRGGSSAQEIGEGGAASKANKKEKRLPFGDIGLPLLLWSITHSCLEGDLPIPTFERGADFIKHLAEKGIFCYELGDKEKNGHGQGWFAMREYGDAYGKKRMKLEYNKYLNKHAEDKWKLQIKPFEITQTEAKMTGYVVKQSSQSWFRIRIHGEQFTDQYIGECKKIRNQYNVNFTTNKLTITGGNILTLAYRFMVAHCPGEKCSLGRILQWMIQSGEYIFSPNCASTYPVERCRAEALWRIVREREPGSVSKEAAVDAFFSNNEGMARFWCDPPLAYQDVGRDREGSMERDCPGRSSGSDSDF